jgi:ribosomal protein L40E
MADETLGYVMLEWVCKRCGARNPGTQKSCSGCGAVISDKDQFQTPAQQEFIKDAAELANAGRGPDVHCKYCGAGNPVSAEVCGNCGSKLDEGRARAAGADLGHLQTGPVPEISCPFCKAMNPASARTCRSCNAHLPLVQMPPPAAQAKSTGSSAGKIGCAIAALLGLVAVVFVGVKCFSTKDAFAVVQSVAWERSIALTEQKPTTRSAWADEIPDGARKGSCSKKVRRTQSEPIDGAEKVCEKPKMVDQGNGTAKVVQKCEYKVSDSWCDYTAIEWREVDKVVARGTNLNPEWPPLRLTSGQREGKRSEEYQVVFKSGNQEYTYSAANASEFSKFSAGSKWTLKVNGFDSVAEVSPAK